MFYWSSKLEVVVIDDEVAIRVGARRRFLKLPRQIARRSVLRANLDRERLTVRFGEVQRAPGGG